VDLVVTPVPEAVEVRADPALPGKVSLFVRGTDGDDTIVVRPVGTSRSSYVITYNGTAETVTGVTGRVYVDGLGGNDSIRVPAVRVPVVLDGGAGNDTLVAGAGNDSLTGGPGDDVLDGGPGVDRLVEAADVDFILESGPAGRNGDLRGGLGTDVLVGNRIEEADLTGGPGDNRLDALLFRGRTWLRGLGGDDYLRGGSGADGLIGGDGDDGLHGGGGRDILIGGTGRDAITGDAGDDLVIGGGTVFDGRPAALAAIQAEWLSGATYATRVKHLRGTLAGGKNGGYVLDATTVFDQEGTPFGLVGGSGRDFFITHPGDLTDRVDAEQVLTV
jgi:Ca2+-binding RTX toxin-like protein